MKRVQKRNLHPFNILVNSIILAIALSWGGDKDHQPSQRFISVASALDQDGEALTDDQEHMRDGSNPLLKDSDQDGYPDAFEAFLSPQNIAVSNAWGFYPSQKIASATTFKNALSHAQEGDILELGPGIYEMGSWNVLPTNRILVTTKQGLYDGRVILRSFEKGPLFVSPSQGMGVSLFQGFALDLRATNQFQNAFWMGGSTPWEGLGASATFKNLSVRMSQPDLRYDAWIFYRPSDYPAQIESCVINLLGATQAHALCGRNASRTCFHACTFICSPENRKTLFDASLVETNQCTFISTPYEGLTTSPEQDEDLDGVSNAEEQTWGTDPFLADSDGDGFFDGDEIACGTNPTDPFSHQAELILTFQQTPHFEQVTNYYGISSVSNGWDIPLPHAFEQTLTQTNQLLITGPLYVKVFEDFNRNGIFDERDDVLYSRLIPRSIKPQIPLLVKLGDEDGDGADDLTELRDGTNPSDPLNYRILMNVVFKDYDYLFHTSIPNRGGFLSSHPQNGLTSTNKWTSSQKELSVDEIVTNGLAFAFCFKDLNQNNLYDEGNECLSCLKLTPQMRNLKYPFWVGKSDADPIVDSVELREGTDPQDPSNYCFHAHVRLEGIFSTSNALSAQAELDGNLIWGPHLVTNRTLSLDLGHRLITHNERIQFTFWDDANHNHILETNETRTSFFVRPESHDDVIHQFLPLGSFDRNGNELPDAWEKQFHLEGASVLAHEDPDHDGLTNLQEYWAGTNPLISDGSNSLFATASRSMQALIEGKDVSHAVPMFSDYLPTLSNFIFGVTTNLVLEPNPNFWAKDLDWSGISIGNSRDVAFWQRAGALISPTHLVTAAHWPPNVSDRYYFRGTNGVIYSSVIVQNVSDPLMRVPQLGPVKYPDLAISLLDPPLPIEFVHPYKIVSSNLITRAFQGKGIPFIWIDQFKQAFIKEIYDFSILGDIEKTRYVCFQQPKNSTWKPFYQMGRDKDSSSPSFLVIDGELIFLGCHTSLGSDGSVWRFSQWIQDQVHKKYPSSETILYDFSAFPILPIWEDQ